MPRANCLDMPPAAACAAPGGDVAGGGAPSAAAGGQAAGRRERAPSPESDGELSPSLPPSPPHGRGGGGKTVCQDLSPISTSRAGCTPTSDGSLLGARSVPSWSPSERSRSPTPAAVRLVPRPAAGQECELFVGNLPPDVTTFEIRHAFGHHFGKLPEYTRRYGDLRSPVVNVRAPAGSDCELAHGRARFCFVAFADETLACTALQMSGLRIRDHSCKVNRRTRDAAVGAGAPAPLDVSPLRDAGLIPWVGGPGAQLLCSVWVGGAAIRDQVASTIRRTLDAALLSSAGVKKRFPELREAIIGIRFAPGAGFAFVEAANEPLASTLVAMGRVTMADGTRLRTGWPARHAEIALERAAPSLLPTDAASEVEEVAPPRAKSPVAEELDASDTRDVFLSGLDGLVVEELWSAIEQAFMTLPAYRVAYPSGHEPVVNLRMSNVTPSASAFARLADDTLASTLVRIGSLCVGRRRVRVFRPRQYAAPAGGPAPPLDLAALRSRPPPPPPPAPTPPLAGGDGGGGDASSEAAPNPTTRPRSAVRKPLFVKPSVLPPVPPPPMPDAMLCVGNLSPLASEEEAVGMLDRHLTRLALGCAAACDVEEGPPIKRVLLRRGRREALVELRTPAVVDTLRPIFDGSDYLGLPLSVVRPPGRPLPGGSAAAAPDSDGDAAKGTPAASPAT